MNLRQRSIGIASHPRWQAPANQARRYAWLGFLLLAGCSTEPGQNFAKFWDRAWGPATEGRPAPPGADGPYPNLGTVPPRPTTPDLASREALASSLATQRQASRAPLSPPPARQAPPGAPAAAIIPPAPALLPGGAGAGAPADAATALPEPAGIPALPDLAPSPVPAPLGAPPPPAVLREVPRRP